MSVLVDRGCIDLHVDTDTSQDCRPVASIRKREPSDALSDWVDSSAQSCPPPQSPPSRSPPSSPRPKRPSLYSEPMSQLGQPPVPAECAVVTMEMQRGVVGDLTMPALAKGQTVLRSCDTGCPSRRRCARRGRRSFMRRAPSPRSDRQGTSLNNPLSCSLARNPGQILHGSEAVELLADFGDTSAASRPHRHHGLTPFTGTKSDATLRALGVSTVIAVGLSVNVGVMALVRNAADLGYRVVVATDAVIGVPSITHRASSRTPFVWSLCLPPSMRSFEAGECSRS